ncbi:G protein-coupled receptor [Operophtera brumata]|uniref:G protein-coupled receptor n=1 Tax=Operophtera brumata TaxID=104452 RepID=A0A0L7L6C9_OPEBR|nr:G protein-coupled receptor [Operophtera brumata]
MYSIYAWGVPLGLTIMLVWINASGEKLLYLYMPMLILICSNWMFYLMTAFNIWRLSRGTSVLDSAAAGTPSLSLA